MKNKNEGNNRRVEGGGGESLLCDPESDLLLLIERREKIMAKKKTGRKKINLCLNDFLQIVFWERIYLWVGLNKVLLNTPFLRLHREKATKKIK